MHGGSPNSLFYWASLQNAPGAITIFRFPVRRDGWTWTLQRIDMAENEPTAAVAEEPEFQYTIRVEDDGPATKRVFVEIPQERITSKLAEQFKELRAEAHIPGFRPGHAPQK